MTKDMRSVVSRELEGAIPPTGITADAIVVAGRRRVLGRRLGIGGAFVTGIAALTAGILALQPTGGALPAAASPSPSASGSASPEPPPQYEQPAYPLPDLDWGTGYVWNWNGGTETETAETVFATDALWQWISEREGLELLQYNDSTEEYEPVTRANLLPVVRVEQSLIVSNDAEHGTPTGHQRPVYSFSAGPNFGSGLVWRFEGADNDANIGLTYYPSGSYLTGAKSIEEIPPSGWDPRHLAAGCEDYRFDSQGTTGKLADFTCRESDGPDGEQILTVECMVNAESDWAQKMVTAIVYLPDGNAIVVDGGAASAEGQPFHTGQGPVMTAEEMVELALAMPDLIVK